MWYGGIVLIVAYIVGYAILYDKGAEEDGDLRKKERESER
jgi:hypothetical protein